MPAAPPISIGAFSGEQPHILPRLMPDTAAQSAIDTRLDDGSLEPIRETAQIAAVAATTWQTIFYYQGNWIGWDTVVDAALGPVGGLTDRLYYTGDGKPKMRVGATIYDLAVPYPLAKLTAAVGSGGAGDVQTRLYVYTYVTSFGEESEPSPASDAVNWQPGAIVTLSGFVLAPTGRDVVSQRIYRSQTGTQGTGLYFVAERPQSAGNFTDNIAVDLFAEPLPSASWNAPPDTLSGLTVLPNGMMAAFSGKDLYFSEPYRPHAWPQNYVLTMDSKIVALGAMGVSVVVTTESQPYLVTGTLPEAMASQKIEQNLPCINKRSLVDLGYAIAWASNQGLVVARADGAITLATGNLFDRTMWADLEPETMIGAQYNGRYVAFYDQLLDDGTRKKGCLFIDLAGQSFLFRSDTYCQAARYDIATESLYYMPVGIAQIRQIDAPNAIRKTLYWKSKEFVLPYPENYGAIMIDVIPDITPVDEAADQARIDALVSANAALIAAGSIGGDINGGALGGPPLSTPIDSWPLNGDMLFQIPAAAATVMTVGIYADKQRIASIGRGNHAERLPGGFRARTWEIDVFTNARIEHIVMAKTMDDLKRTP